MIKVVSIVEGDGEVVALPVLLRRLEQWLTPGRYVHIERPIRVRREQFLNREEVFVKQLRLAAALCGPTGLILVLLDADDDCPVDLSAGIRARAAQVVPGHTVSVVLANREYEGWFIAAARSLDGCRGFACPGYIPAPEAIRGAKQWISKHVPNGAYHEVIDQPALSARLDLEQAHAHSRSFRKLCSDWQSNIDSLSQG